MNAHRKLNIAFGAAVRGVNRLHQEQRTWEDIVRDLRESKALDIGWQEFMELGRSRETSTNQLLLKESAGWWMGAHFKGKRRKKEALDYRDILGVDIDNAKERLDIEMALAEHEFVLHSTVKFHSEKEPGRFRLAIPLTRRVSPEEYEPLMRMVLRDIIEDIDYTTFDVNRVMFNPAHCNDVEPYFMHNEGSWVDPDEMLSQYNDWRDQEEWPRASEEDTGIVDLGTKIKWSPDIRQPIEIGAFCRAYNINEAIVAFDLPYYPTDNDERWTYEGGTAQEGLAIYDDGTRCTSHHNTDPANNGRSVHAFDLVRIHKFGDWTQEEVDGNVPVSQRHGQVAMLELARSLEPVINEMTRMMREEMGEIDDDDDVMIGDQAFPADGPIEIKHQSKVKKLDVKRIEKDIAGSVTKEELLALVPVIASMKLNPMENDMLAGDIAGKSKDLGSRISKKAVADAIKKAGEQLRFSNGEEDEPDEDQQDYLIDYILHQKFEKGRIWKCADQVNYLYRSGLWRLSDPNYIRGMIDDELFLMRKGQYATLPPAVLEYINSKSTSTLSNELWPLMQRRVTSDLKSDPLGMQELQKPMIVNCLNTEIHFDEDGMYSQVEHCPEHYLTHQARVMYDADAECPVFQGMLDRIFRDQQDPEGVKRHWLTLCGYLLQLRRDHKIWMLWYGSGDNGKSTLAAVLQAMLGDAAYPVENLAKLGEDSHATAYMMNALLLLDDDYPAGEDLPDSMVKKFSEAKQIMANPKFGGHVRFVCRAPILILSNHWPRTRDISDALRARAQVFSFNTKISMEEQDPALLDYVLENELSGVLNLMLDAYASMLCMGGELNLPVDCLKARDLWFRNSNIIQRWIDERCVVELGTDVSQQQDDGELCCTDQGILWTSFDEWRSREDSSYVMRGRALMGRNAFYARLEEMGFSRRGMGRNRHGFVGLKLVNEDLPD